MSISLDIGTRAIRSLRRQGSRLVGRQNIAAYVVLPDRPQQRRLLESLSYRYAICEGSLLVIGRAAGELAETLQIPEVPLLRDGVLPLDDSLARQVVASLIDSLLPPSSSPAEICCIAPPCRLEDKGQCDFFAQLVRLNGYTPSFLDAGTAVVLSELGADKFTGLGISFGAGSTRATLSHRGVPHLLFTIPHGGNWIDARLAESEDSILWDSEGNRYLNQQAISSWKESNVVSVTHPISSREQRVALLYEELIQELLEALREHLSADEYARTLIQPVPMVCTGGVTRIRGFHELLERSLTQFSLPLKVSDIRYANDSGYTVARGCLIRAEVDAGEPRIGLARVA